MKYTKVIFQKRVRDKVPLVADFNTSFSHLGTTRNNYGSIKNEDDTKWK